jgi:hypothetical protein
VWVFLSGNKTATLLETTMESHWAWMKVELKEIWWDYLSVEGMAKKQAV